MKAFWKKPLNGFLVVAILGILSLVQFSTPVIAVYFEVAYLHPMEMQLKQSSSATAEFTIQNQDFTGDITLGWEHEIMHPDYPDMVIGRVPVPLDYDQKTISVEEGKVKDVVVTFDGNEDLESVYFTGTMFLTPVSGEMYIGGYKIDILTTHQVDDEPVIPGYFIDVIIGPEEGSGSVTLDDPVGLYQDGTEVTLTAVPNPGWEFDSWTGVYVDDLADPDSATTTIIMDSDKQVVANFTRVSHTLTMVVSPEGAGTTDPEVGTHTYNWGSVVEITATAEAGWYFVNWSGYEVDDPNSASTTVTMDADKTVIANFVNVSHTLTMSVSPEGAGTVTPEVGVHTYGEGRVVPLNAIAAEGWEFDSWTGDVADPSSDITTITIDSDKSVTANFIEKEEAGFPWWLILLIIAGIILIGLIIFFIWRRRRKRSGDEDS